MSKDIRSFFTITSKKQGISSPSPKAVVKSVKRSVPKLSSDEEIAGTPNDEKKKRQTKTTGKSKRLRIISDDEEEVPKKRESPRKFNLQRLKTSDSSTGKSVDVKDIFGSGPIKRTMKPKPKSVQNSVISVIESDEEMNESLLIAYNDAIDKRTPEKKKSSPKRTPKKTPNKANFSSIKESKKSSEKKKSPIKMNKNESPEKIKFPIISPLMKQNSEEERKKSVKKTPEKKTPRRSRSPQKSKSKYPILEQLDSEEEMERSILKAYKNTTPVKLLPNNENKSKTPNKFNNSKQMESPIRNTKSNKNTPEKQMNSSQTVTTNVKSVKKSKNSSKKQEEDLNESGLDPDQERHEKRRMQSILYQKFKNRSEVLNHGCKEVPEGKPNCLVRLNFVITGVLESLDRQEATELIKKYGGKVTTGLSKKTTYMVLGEDAGLAKIAKADELGTKQITEDQLLLLIGNSLTKTNYNNKTDFLPSAQKRKLNMDEHESESVTKKRKVSPSKLMNESPLKVKKEKTPVKIKNEETSIQIKKEKPQMKIKEEKILIKEEKIGNEIEIIDTNSLPWVEKYKPTSVKDIIGQQGNASNCVKLTNWLKKWYVNHDGKKKLSKPNPWAKNDDGSYYKAALLSGPPGIGKTTTASLVCKELDLDVVEFNASDTRSKKLLKEEVSELLSNQSLFGYFHGKTVGITKKHVLLMDEVDGMAGNEDRGGMQELIGLIKESSVPIICMCNDRNHQKMQSLVNYCYDLRFNKPRVEQIRGPIMSVLFKENFKIPANVLNEIIAATNNDIRQTLNHLSMLSAKKDLGCTQNDANPAKKDLKLGPWEVVRKVFSAEEHKNMSIFDKCDLFFHDYSLGPLFVQQNYLSVVPNAPKNELLNRVSMAADSLSLGDLVDKRIRSNMAWSLLPIQGMFSSVMVGEYMEGRITAQINFPGWLGKNSKYNKRKRLAQEVHDHTRIRTSASVSSFRLDYAPILIASIVNPLKEKGVDGVQDALEIIKEYRLLREDIDSLIELTSWPGKKNPMDGVESKVKAALTRAYNKEVTPYIYSATAAIKKKKSEVINDNEDYENNDEQVSVANSSDEENDDNLESDTMIKMKKTTASTSKLNNTKNVAKPKSRKGK